MDSNFWMGLLATFLEGMVPLAIIVIGILIKNALKKANASKEQLALVEGAYDILARAARTTNQIWVEAIKEAGGKLTEEEAAQAREDTIQTFKAMLTEAMAYAIEQAYGSIDKWIDLNLESAVNEVKELYLPILAEEAEVEE